MVPLLRIDLHLGFPSDWEPTLEDHFKKQVDLRDGSQVVALRAANLSHESTDQSQPPERDAERDTPTSAPD